VSVAVQRLPVSPFVRRRWRRRLGLPDSFVTSVGVAGAPAIDERTASAALFTCSAAVVGSTHVVEALSLGTPTVCTTEVAASVGAIDGEHVLIVDDPADARRQAEALAADDARAAALARNAPRLVRAPDASSPPTAMPGIARLVDELARLGTPPGSSVARRVGGYVASLGPSAAAAVELLDVDGSTAGLPPDAESGRRVAEAFGLPMPAPAPFAPRVQPRRTMRARLAGKSARQIAGAVWQRVRRAR
jgi:hypothetical protein